MSPLVRRVLKVALAAVGALALLLSVAWFALVRAPVPEPPPLEGRLVEGSLRVGELDRHFLAYVPSQLASPPPLVLVLHASQGDGAQMRIGSIYGFDILADREGFVVAYPDGFERHWNDCRRGGPYSANTQDVDDPAFLAALVDHLVERFGIDRGRVYATGLSNGGQMSLRLALERPDLVAAVAPVAASLPTDDNLDCAKSGRPVAVLFVNGTDDPMNPYAGGPVALYGVWGNRGSVLSAEASAEAFAGWAGHAGPPEVTTLPDTDPGDGSTIEVRAWRGPEGPDVVLYRVEGGGHTFPNRTHPYPRFIGRTNADIDGAEEIWRFFSQRRR
jgi:polyhydroxybutyrate depolymerase